MTPPLVIPPYLKEAPLTGLIGMGGGATSHRVYTASGDDAYQIKKSVRFNHSKKTYLQSYALQKGNTRTWTWAAWVKRNIITDGTGADQKIFSASSDGSNMSHLEFSSNDSINFVTITGGSIIGSIGTGTAVFRDPNAWMHICAAYDSTQSASADRFKLYVNGKQISLTISNTIEQHQESHLGSKILTLGGSPIGDGGQYLPSQFADVYLIDGLQLSAAAFGSLDSAGVFNPKNTYDDDGKFILPYINNGTTWSNPSYWSGTERGSNPYDNGFDGDTSSTIAQIDNSGTTGWITYTFTPPEPITFVDRVEIHGSITSVRWSINGEPWTTGTSNGIWDTIATGGGTITTIDIEADNNYPEWRGIRIDGLVLLDGFTDPTTLNNLNDGTIWSDYITGATISPSGTYGVEKAFNGLVSTAYNDGNNCCPNDNTTCAFIPPSTITAQDRLRVFFWRYAAGAAVYQNNTDITSTVAAVTGNSGGGWVTLSDKTINTTHGLTWSRVTSGQDFRLCAIEVDGIILIDANSDSSFHLKFDDISSNARLGRNSLTNKGISDATGALPIYNTTADSDGYDDGSVKGSGYRTDSNSAYLQLAVPGDVKTDVSHSIRGSGSAKTLTQTGTVDVIKTHSRFYGSSMDFGGSDDVLKTDAGVLVPDANKKFCVEVWVYNDGGAGKPIEMASTFGAGDYFYIEVTSNGAVRGRGGSGTDAMTDNGVVPDKVWTHLAYTHDGTTGRVFVNGVLLKEDVSSSSNQSTLSACIGAWAGVTPEEEWDGKMNDLRVYFGVAKYTSNFTPPTRNDFTVNNIASAGTASRYTSGTDWNSAIWDGSLDSQGGVTGGSYEVLTDQSITVTTSFEINTNDENGQVNTIKDGNGNEYQCDSDAGTGYHWRPLYNANSQSGTNYTGTLTGPIQIKVSYGGSHIYAVRVDGEILIEHKHVDVSTDTPTNYGDDTGVGGEVRGNYATLNPLDVGSKWTLSRGNLKAVSTGDYGCLKSTIGMTSGKWYAEMTAESDNNAGAVGVARYDHANTWIGGSANDIGYGYLSDGRKATTSDTRSSYGATWATGDVIGLALDLSGSTGTVTFYKNGSTQGQAFTLTTADGPWFFAACDDSNSNQTTQTWNFGQRAFVSTAPAGHKCLCTHNLPDTFGDNEDTNNPSKYFDALTYTGSAASRNLKILGFSPDLSWVKRRSGAESHVLANRLIGADSFISSDLDSAANTAGNCVTAFNSNGITVGSQGIVNDNAETFISWHWDAGTAGAANNDGSINVTNQWVNTAAGFSITKYEGTEAAATVGHGLGAAPELVMVKNLETASSNWVVWHKGIAATEHLYLNGDDAAVGGQTNTWNSAVPTSSVFSMNASWWSNDNGVDHVAYCWTPINGYSAFGSYEGNGSTTGPFIYTGFRPRYILYKNADTAGRNWFVHDTERSPTNGGVKYLMPSANYAEGTNIGGDLDILSNGFKWRTANNDQNNSGDTFIYACFAEHPLKVSRAR